MISSRVEPTPGSAAARPARAAEERRKEPHPFEKVHGVQAVPARVSGQARSARVCHCSPDALQEGINHRTKRMSSLFAPLRIRDIEFRNRVFVSPMCQYSAPDGRPTEWHMVHLGSRAVGGAGLVFTEATAVSHEGRISRQHRHLERGPGRRSGSGSPGSSRIRGAVAGIQLAHAGRKASTQAPWLGDRAPCPRSAGGSPSPRVRSPSAPPRRCQGR